MKKLLALALVLFSISVFAQTAQLQAFAPNNSNTITFTANISGSIPTPVLAPGCQSNSQICQYLITNNGAYNTFISYASTSALATTNCVIPTGTATPVIPLLGSTQIIVTLPPNTYFCGITASGTSVIYVTPGRGM